MEENLFNKWHSRQELQKFLGYGNTKMSQLTKDYGIRTVKIGKKVFYSAEDVARLFNSSIKD